MKVTLVWIGGGTPPPWPAGPTRHGGRDARVGREPGGARAAAIDLGRLAVLVRRARRARPGSRREGPRHSGRPLARGPSDRNRGVAARDRPRRADLDAESRRRSLDRVDLLARQPGRLPRPDGGASEDRHRPPRVPHPRRRGARVRASQRALRRPDPPPRMARGRERRPEGLRRSRSTTSCASSTTASADAGCAGPRSGPCSSVGLRARRSWRRFGASRAGRRPPRLDRSERRRRARCRKGRPAR